MLGTTANPKDTQAPPKKDIDDLRAFAIELLNAGHGNDAIDLLIELIAKLHNDNNAKAQRIAKLLRHRFGRRSEKVTREQLELFLQELEDEDKQDAALPDDSELPAPEGEPVDTEPKRKGKKRKGRKPLPENLPRKVVVIEPSPEEKVCETCGADKTRIGCETSELIEFVPAHFVVIEQRRVKYACKSCSGGVVIGEVGDKPIEKGRPGPGLLAQVVVSKYQDHLPLYRQNKIYKRLGVDIAVSTMVGWVAAVAMALEPIYLLLVQLVLGAEVLGVDDTVLRVLDRKHPKGVKRGHIWSYVGYEAGQPVRTVFDYTPTWSGDGPCSFMKGRVGYIQGDAYKGIDKMFAEPDSEAIRVGCWSHARRKYKDALDGKDLRAAVALKLIGKLYEVEEQAKQSRASPDERQRLRDKLARPVVNQIGKWVEKIWPGIEPGSPLGKALTYTVNQWKTLIVYLDDGRVPIDNNGVEQRIRPVALGRKNYLFAGSDEGARRAAVIYTILACCYLAGVEPFAYVRDVLDRLSKGWLNSRLSELLPENWKPEEPPTDSTTETE